MQNTFPITNGLRYNWGLILYRGATGAARVPKPDKTPNTVACRRVLFYKIQVGLAGLTPYGAPALDFLH